MQQPPQSKAIPTRSTKELAGKPAKKQSQIMITAGTKKISKKVSQTKQNNPYQNREQIQKSWIEPKDKPLNYMKTPSALSQDLGGKAA